MGFVSTAAGSDAETLYLASNDGAHTLVSLDPSTRATRSIGPLVAADGWSPELTGTSGARLFGFFTMTTEPSFVQEIDRATGAAKGPRWPLGNDAMAIDAWAFAQWGGVFYVFVTTLGESAVYAVDPKTSTARVVRSGLPFRITGAGVSTCAPERDGG